MPDEPTELSGWVDIYHPDFWDEDLEGYETPEPGNPEHAGRYSRVTRESYELNWSKKGWVTLGDEAPAPVGSLQGGTTPEVAPTSDEEDSTPKKASSASKSTAKSK